MYKNKENLFVDFKNLMIKSFDEDVKKIEFDLITENIKEWGIGDVIKTKNTDIKSNEVGGFDWFEDELDYISFVTDDSEDLFGNYQNFYESILDEMVLKKDVSLYCEYFHKVLIEFSKIPETGVTANNTLDEAYILHSRLIVPKILKHYKNNIDNEIFSNCLLKLAVDLSHFILLTFPDKFLKKLPIKRPIPESESNGSLHDIGWQSQSYQDYLDVYISLKNYGAKTEIEIMKSTLIELNKTHFNSNPENLLSLEDEKDITLSILDKAKFGYITRNLNEDSEENFNKVSLLFLFNKMFYNNADYCIETLLPKIHEQIANTKNRTDLDSKLFSISQSLINQFIKTKYTNISALENALKYASLVSVNTINCCCGKYKDTIYKGVICDICNVVVSKGSLKRTALDFIFKKLSGKEVYGWSHDDLNGEFEEFVLNNQTCSIFIEHINKIDDIKERRKKFLSLLIFTQNKEYTFREKLLEKFRACQSDSVEEFMDKSNLTYSKWAKDNLTDSEYYRKSYYKSLNEEKIKLLYDESQWEEENFIENVIFNPDPWGGEPNNELINYHENIEHEKYVYESYTEQDYTDKYIYNVISSFNEKLLSDGLKQNEFLSEIGEFYYTLIENYKKNKNIKSMNLCIKDFMGSLNKNGDKSIIKFLKLLINLIDPIALIEALNKIESRNNIRTTTNYIIDKIPLDKSLLLSNLNQKVTLKNDFILLNNKFDIMNKKQIFKYLFQYSENIKSLESFLSHIKTLPSSL